LPAILTSGPAEDPGERSRLRLGCTDVNVRARRTIGHGRVLRATGLLQSGHYEPLLLELLHERLRLLRRERDERRTDDRPGGVVGVVGDGGLERRGPREPLEGAAGL